MRLSVDSTVRRLKVTRICTDKGQNNLSGNDIENYPKVNNIILCIENGNDSMINNDYRLQLSNASSYHDTIQHKSDCPYR